MYRSVSRMDEMPSGLASLGFMVGVDVIVACRSYAVGKCSYVNQKLTVTYDSRFQVNE